MDYQLLSLWQNILLRIMFIANFIVLQHSSHILQKRLIITLVSNYLSIKLCFVLYFCILFYTSIFFFNFFFLLTFYNYYGHNGIKMGHLFKNGIKKFRLKVVRTTRHDGKKGTIPF